MTDRIVKVVLRGEIGQFVGSMRAASSAAKSTLSGITDGSRESAKYRDNLTALGTTAGKVGLVAAAGVGVAIRAFANFDQAMSNVAATGDDAKNNIDDLRAAAIKFGASTQYSATEAANAIEELEKAGVSAKDILGGGLAGSLNLAAAGSLGVADAASIAATAMVQFGLDGDKVPHIADLLAAAAGKAQGSVEDMGQALKYVGPVASQMGISIEETTGTIAELANSGILADQAGTSLRGMLTSLTSPSKIAATTMADLGITLYDAQGKFVGFDGVAGQLHDTLGTLSNAERDQALGRIFGNEQITAARVLYAGGAEDVKKWTKSVNDSGYAQEVASTKMDNLKGDIEQLRGAFETALIGSGEGANTPLRETVQLLTELINIYNGIPGPIKTAATAAAALTAIIGGGAFVASRAISGYAGLKKNLGEVGGAFENVNKKALAVRGGAAAAGVALASISGPAHNASEGLGDLTDVAAATALGFAAGGPWGAAISGGIALFSAFGESGKNSAADIAGLTATLDEQTGAVTANTASWVAKQLADSDASRLLVQGGASLSTQTDAILGNKDALDQVTAASQKFGIVGDQAIKGVLALRDGVEQGKKSNVDATAAIEGSSEAQKAATNSSAALAAQTQATAAEIKAQNDAARNTADAFFDVSKGADDAKISLHDWISDLNAQATALTNFGNNAAQAGKRGLEEGLIQDLQNMGPAGAQRLAQLADASDAELARANAAWRRGQRAIDNYIDEFGGIPKNFSTDVRVDARQAIDAINLVGDKIGRLHGKKLNILVTTTNRTATTDADGSIHLPGGRRITRFANGGENHVAQIGDGHTRIWNEPETGGEAYIPFAASKRKRSQQIAMQTVSRLGGVASFADGGTSGVTGSVDLVGAGIAPAIGAAVKQALYGTTFKILPDGSVRAKELGG